MNYKYKMELAKGAFYVGMVFLVISIIVAGILKLFGVEIN